jgi:hypothetical protein
MNHNEQTDAFTFELTNLITRFVNEFDINIHTIVGVLEDVKFDILVGKDIEFEVDDSGLSDDDAPDNEIFGDDDDIFK